MALLHRYNEYKPIPPLENCTRPSPTPAPPIGAFRGNPVPTELLKTTNEIMLEKIESLEQKMDKILSILNKNDLQKEIISLSKQNNLPIF